MKLKKITHLLFNELSFYADNIMHSMSECWRKNEKETFKA